MIPIKNLSRRSQVPTQSSSSMQVWRCHGCGCFHLTCGEFCISFTPEQFAEFTQAVTGCYWESEVNDLVNMTISAMPA